MSPSNTYLYLNCTYDTPGNSYSTLPMNSTHPSGEYKTLLLYPSDDIQIGDFMEVIGK